jgi:hypothetical protein
MTNAFGADETQSAGDLSHPTNNTAFTFDTMMDSVRNLGKEAALGRDSLPKLAVTITRAASEGIVTMDANKHGDGVDDAKKIYGEYIASDSRKAVHDHSPDGLKAQVSKLRSFIKFGAGTKYDAVDVLDRAMRMRKEMAAADTKSVKSAYAAYVDVAREQYTKEAPMTDDEMKQVISKKASEETTIEKVLQGMEKTLEKLITGEHKAGKDQSDQIIKAHELIKERLAALIVINERAAKQAELARLTAELGVAA